MTTRTSRRCRVLGGAAVVLAAVCGCGQGTQEVDGAPAAGTPTSSATSATSASSAASGSASGSSSAPGGPSASSPTLPVPDAGPVRITAPAEGEHLPAGVMGVVGTGTAPEGTLLWRITDASGEVVSDGHTTAGANGEVGDFSIQQTVQAGTCAPCTVRVWVPDDSDGEGAGEAGATRTFFVD